MTRVAGQLETHGSVTRSLRIRNFRLFFGGQLISQTGTWLTMVAQALFVLHLTDNSGVAVGLLTACQFLPVLVLGAWAGLVADRSNKRTLLLIAQSCAMLQSFAMAALIATGDPPLLAIYAVAALGGTITAFDSPARRSFVVEMVPDDHLQNAVSLNSALMTGSRIVGPALAGLLIVTAGYTWCFVIDGVSYIAVLVGLWRIRTSELRPAPITTPGKGQVREGLRYVRGEPDLFVPLVMMTIVGTFAMNFVVVMPLFVKQSLAGSDTNYTLVYSVMSIGSLGAALLKARLTSTTNRQVITGTAAYGASLLLIASMPNLAWTFPAALVLGAASVMCTVPATTNVQMRALPSMRGRVLALQGVVWIGTTPVGAPILGWVCEHLGPRVGLLIGAAACAVAVLWAMLIAPPMSGEVGATQPIGAA